MTSTPATPAPRPPSRRRGSEELREVIAGNLLTARERTRLLTESVDDTDLVRQHSPLMSPLVWDLAHIANQEELWLLRNVGGREPMHPEIDPLYDAFEHPRAARPTLPLLPPAEARAYAHEVRGRVMDLLESARFSGAPLVTGGFALRHGGPARAAARRDHADHPPAAPGRGRAHRGAARAAAAGRPAAAARGARARRRVHHGHLHRAVVAGQRAARAPGRTCPSFYLDTTPVSNAAYQEFIADGGYDDPRWWTPEGWDHRQRAGLTAPLYWRREGRPGSATGSGSPSRCRPPSR